MAITADIPTTGGLTALAAYIRVTDIIIKKDNDAGTFYMTYGVAVHIDEATRNSATGQPIICPEVDRFKIKDLAEPPADPYAAAYADLKAQAVVESAVDVI